MPAAALSEDILRQTVEFLKPYLAKGIPLISPRGNLPSALSLACHDAMRAGFVKTPNGWRGRVLAAARAGLVPDHAEAAAPPPPPPPESTPETRRVAADIDFHKSKAKDLERALERAERVIDSLFGFDRPFDIPQWLPTASQSRHRAVMNAFLSDLHCGQNVAPDEIEGLGEYNVDVFRRRLRRYTSAVCEVGPRWMADCDIAGAVVYLGGDLIDGDIHEELIAFNELTSLEQVEVCGAELALTINAMADRYGRVHVAAVGGNHGRTTKKSWFKGAARLSYDILIAKRLADTFGNDPRVTFQISKGIDLVIPVLGWSVFLTHGDKIGTGGGQGFAGPLLPIVRGQKKMEIQQFRARRPFDLLLTGHYHASSQPGPHLANGSMPGYTEFANGIRAAVEPPQQWAFVISERWLLRERAEIKLEDPIPPPKPRVRVPAISHPHEEAA